MNIKIWIKNQQTHFQQLSKTEQSLLLSFFLYGLAAPLLGAYINTFLWRESEDPLTLILFNGIWCVAVPVGFLLNAYALRRTETKFLFFLACLLQGTAPIALTFLPGNILKLVPLLAFILGISAGFFWANRNYLTSKITQGSHRIYFISMEGVLETVAGIVAPISIGWFLVLGDHFSLYTLETAYQGASLCAFVILLFAGRTVYQADLPPSTQNIDRCILRRPGKLWQRLRVMEMLNGFINGVEWIVPAVIILTLLGSEEAVGTIDSLTALASALILFAVSKHIKHSHHRLLLGVWFLGVLVGGLAFAWLFTAAGAIVYFVLSGLSGSFRWTSLMSLMYEVVDRVTNKKDAAHRFVYIMDREIFLAVGRFVALILLFISYQIVPQETTRFALLLIVVAQGLLLLIMKPLARQLKHEEVRIDVVASEPAP